MPPSPQDTAAGYRALYTRAKTRADIATQARAVAQKIIAQRAVYDAIAVRTGVPMAFTGPVHNRESGLRIDRHLHNGDPLAARTVHVPAGRPANGMPPFTFIDSAVDALTMPPHALQKVGVWSLERILYEAEKYNGWGYLGKTNSPYLWAGTSEHTAGKFVADHVYDPAAVDKQLGCVPVLKALAELDPSIAAMVAASEPVPPPDVTAAVARSARTTRNGGAIIAASGAAGETINGASRQPEQKSATGVAVPSSAPQPPLSSAVTWGLLGIGLVILAAGIIIERRRLALLARKWRGA
jgi:lysozyme family protein